MNVLSLFDGISTGRLSLERAGVKVDNYFSSEVDTHCMKVSANNWPDIIQIGGVEEWKNWDLPKIDLIIGGTPCQGFSLAGKGLAFDDPRSKLFFTYVDILNALRVKNPDIKFLLENVKMRKDYENAITDIMGVDPIRINSEVVSAQYRQRLYWTNIPQHHPIKREYVKLVDIVQSGWVDRDKAYCIDASYFKGSNLKQYIEKSRRQRVFEKVDSLTEGEFELIYPNRTLQYSGTTLGELPVSTKVDTLVTVQLISRSLTPIECERLQTLPDDYTAGVSNTQRYKMLGNGWTADVISHLFKGLK